MARKKARRQATTKPAPATKRPTGKLIAAKRKAAREGWADWIQSEADERALLVGYRFDQQRADHVFEFGPRFLQLSGEYEGTPFQLLDFQMRDIIGPLFGWVHDSEEYGRTVRRFRRAYVQVPKKNGKSPLGYYVALYCLAADGPNVRGARVYSASTDKEQASIVHGDAIAAVEASPQLRKVLRTNRTRKNIAYPAMNGFYRVLSSAPRRNEGWNASCIIADELHQWYGRELYDALRWAFATRSEPIFFAITTAGDDTESLCYEVYTQAKAVLEGRTINLQLLPVIYEADPEDDIHDKAVQKKANPALGHHIKASSLRDDIAEAEDEGPAAVAKLRQLRFNIWQTAASPWLNVTRWDAGKVARDKSKTKSGRPKRVDCWQDYRRRDLAKRPCFAGLDLAYTTDLSALVLLFPNDSALAAINGKKDLAADKKGIFWTLPFFWLPQDTAHAYRKKVRYFEWAKRNWLKITTGGETDFDTIREDIVDLAGEFELRGLWFDPLYAGYLAQRLALEHGIHAVEFGQTMTNYAEPTKMLERLVLQKRIRHTGNQLLTWCFKNTSVKEDANGNKRPVKPKANDHRKIDGTVATIMATAGMMRGELPPGPWYANNDVEFI